MDIVNTALLLALIAPGVRAVEFCSGQQFEASCGRDEVIIIQSGLFGRMHLGRCVEQDLGFLGCYLDVLPILNEKCSGKQQCSFTVTDSVFTRVNPCSKELKLYLEAGYRCQRVLPSSSICNHQKEVILRDKVSFLSSRQLIQDGCLGSSGFQPSIFLKASPGQQINVSLIDLEFKKDLLQSCVNYGEIEDLHTRQGTTLCGGRSRSTHIITSNSHHMQLTFNSNFKNQNFALRFEVSGCPDIPTQSGSWVQKDGNITTVGCHNSQQTWSLVCDGNHWIGSLGNCSQAPRMAPVEMGRIIKTGPLTSEVAITLISCITILLCISVVALAANYWKRNVIRSLMVRLQHDTLQHTTMATLSPNAAMTASVTSQGDESDYMPLNLKPPKSTMEESEDALYDFCFMSGAGATEKSINNHTVLLANTLPNQGESKVNNSTVRFKTTHSPFRKKQMETINRFECVIEE